MSCLGRLQWTLERQTFTLEKLLSLYKAVINGECSDYLMNYIRKYFLKYRRQLGGKNLQSILTFSCGIDCFTDYSKHYWASLPSISVSETSYSLFVPQDLHMVELEDFKYGGTNITALRLVDPSDEKVWPRLVRIKSLSFWKVLLPVNCLFQ